MPNQRQPELPIDPPAASVVENYGEKCFEDLLGCIGDLEPLARKLPIDDERDAAMVEFVEMCARMLNRTVNRWREAR